MDNIPAAHQTPQTGIVCYFIYWTIQFPFMLISPQRIRWLFLAKAIIVPPSWLALLIWAFVKVPPSKGLFTLHATATGSDFSWAYLTALNVSLGFYATLAVNIPDFTVGVSRPRQDVLVLMESPSDTRKMKDRKANPPQNERRQSTDARILKPICSTRCYPDRVHIFRLRRYCGHQRGYCPLRRTNPVEPAEPHRPMDEPTRCVLHVLFFRSGNPRNEHVRHSAASFSVGTRLLITADGCSSANSLSAANDMTVLLPRYINIRRGQIICAFLGGWALCPWEILARLVHHPHLSHRSRVGLTSGTLRLASRDSSLL